MVSWEDFAITIGGLTPVIFVGGVIATQELSKASHSSDHGELTPEEMEVCIDILKKLKETKQIYIVDLDYPISITKTLFRLLDAMRRRRAEKMGIPEEQFDIESYIAFMVGLPRSETPELCIDSNYRKCAASVMRFMRDVGLYHDSVRKEDIGEALMDITAMSKSIRLVGKWCSIDVTREIEELKLMEKDLGIEGEWDVAGGRLNTVLRLLRDKLGEREL